MSYWNLLCQLMIIMLVGYLNIQRALLKSRKIAVLESILNVDGFDVFGIGETDLDAISIPPTVEGYSTIVHRNEDGISRLCVYIKSTIAVEDVIHLKDHPAIVIHLARVSLGFVYNGFTVNPYTTNKKRISEKERCNNAIDMLDQIQFLAKKVWLYRAISILIISRIQSQSVESPTGLRTMIAYKVSYRRLVLHRHPNLVWICVSIDSITKRSQPVPLTRIFLIIWVYIFVLADVSPYK